MELDPVRTRLLKLIGDNDTDLSTVSKAIGRNHAYLQQFIKSGKPRVLPEEVRDALGVHFGISPDELRAAARAPTVPSLRRDLITIGGNEYALIPVFDLRLSAGPGAWIGDESEPMHFEPYRHQWLRSITTASSEALMIARVDGDSMETTLFHGDQVLLDRTRQSVNRDGIFGYRIGDALNVKRFSVNPRSRLVTIISDNRNYPPYPDVNPDELDVIGRVIWLGRQV